MSNRSNPVIARSPAGATWQSRKNEITSPSARNDRLYWFCCVALTAMYFLFLNPYLDVRGFNAHDPAVYISKAINLLKGIGYGEQYAEVFMPSTVQPPFFSFMLTPIFAVFGIHFFAFKLFMVVIAGLLSLAMYKLFFYFFKSKERAIQGTLLLMASPVIFGLSHRVLADVPLFLFVAIALWTLDCYLKKSVSIFSKWLFFAAIASSVAYLTKQTGLAVIVGGYFLLLHPDFRNKMVIQKLILYSVIAGIPIFIWHAWCATIPDDLWYWTMPATRDYLWKNPFTPVDGFLSVSEFIVRVRHNLVWGISNNIAMVFFAPFYFLEGGLLGFLLSVPIVLWLAWQWARSFIKQLSVLEGFVFFSLALMVPKYLGMATRHIAIIWPALIVYGFRGMSSLPDKVQTYVLNSLLIISLCTTFVISWDQWKNPYGSKTLKDYVTAGQEAKTLFPAASVCKAPLSPHWYVLSGHKCQFSGQDLVTYFVSLSDSAPQNLDPYKDVELNVLKEARDIGLLWKNKGGVKKVYENDNFALFQVNRGN